MKCKPCGHSTFAIDVDTRPGKFWVSLKWGPLVTSQGIIDEQNIDGYKVHIVDRAGRIVQHVGTESRIPGLDESCCSSDAYTSSFSGDIPQGYDRLMISPYKGRFTLPQGVLTNTIIDAKTGEAEMVTGKVSLTVANPNLFIETLSVRGAIREALAETIDDIDVGMIDIASITRVRRLSGLTSLGDRKLAAGMVKVVYRILLPQSYRGVPITAASIPVTKLKHALNARVEKRGLSGLAVLAVVVFSPTTKSIGTASAGAHRVMPAVVMLFLVFFLAQTQASTRPTRSRVNALG